MTNEANMTNVEAMQYAHNHTEFWAKLIGEASKAAQKFLDENAGEACRDGDTDTMDVIRDHIDNETLDLFILQNMFNRIFAETLISESFMENAPELSAMNLSKVVNDALRESVFTVHQAVCHGDHDEEKEQNND